MDTQRTMYTLHTTADLRPVMLDEGLRLGKLSRFFNFYHASPIPDGDLETLRWLIGIRFKIGSMLLSLILLSILTAILPVDTATNLLLVNSGYLLVNVLYVLLLRGNPTDRRVRWVRQVQVPEKIFLCTLAIYMSGGVLTPMFILYSLAILESVILLNPAGVYRASGSAVLCYLSLTVIEAYHIVPQIGSSWGAVHPVSFSVYSIYAMLVTSMLIIAGYMGSRIASLITLRNKQIEYQMRDLRTLYDITNGLGNIMDEAALTRYLAFTLKTLQNASVCVISLVGKEGQIEAKASAGVPLETVAGSHNAALNMPGLPEMFLRGESLIVENLDKMPEYKPLVLDPTTKSIYVFPIKSEAKVLGVISLTFSTMEPISPEYNRLLATIASQTGLILQRARLFCDAQRLAREMSILYDVGLQTGSTLSKDEIIRRTSDNIVKLMNPDMYYIAMFDEETNIITFEVFVECGHEMPRMKIPLDKGSLTSHIIKEGKPLLIPDWLTEGDKYNAIAQKSGADMLSYLGVPMISEARVMGVISVQRQEPHAFDDHDKRLLSALAAQTATALENAKLHQLAQDQGKLDSLTKAYNHGHFVELVRKAVADSDTNDTQVSLIMIDIDHFKQYNDTFGHVAGDNVLRMVANALKSSVRETDFVGRWGGEEFGVLLPSVSTMEAKKIARMIRRAISELYPVDGHGHVIPNPTVSQGISSYPHPSPTPSDLIEQADGALYHAKKQGRNKLVIYENSGSMREATTSGHLPVPGIMKDVTVTTGHLSAIGVFSDTTNTTGNLIASLALKEEDTITDNLTSSRNGKGPDRILPTTDLLPNKRKKKGALSSRPLTAKGSKGGTTFLETLS